MRTIALALSFLLLTTTLHAQKAYIGGTQLAEQTAKYKQLVERAKKNDSTLDYMELIAAYWDIYSALPKAPNRDEMTQAFKDKNYRRAVELAEVVLDTEFQNRGLHTAMANAYKELGETAKAEQHRAWAEKLFDALLKSGDGKTVQTAFCVQGMRDEYEIMAHFGYKASVQAFSLANGTELDTLSGREERTGKSVSLMFDISGNVSRCVQSHRASGK